MKTALIWALLVALAASPGVALAQAPASTGDDERERKFIEALQRQDPASAERFVALRDARAKAVAELNRVEAQYRAAGLELRSIFLPQLRQAQSRYAESSLALLDFLDARDRQDLATYEREIARINRVLEERERMRAELGKLLQGN